MRRPIEPRELVWPLLQILALALAIAAGLLTIAEKLG